MFENPIMFSMLVSVIIHQGYQWFLLSSYEIGDLTKVYPIARGTGPLVATVISIFILLISRIFILARQSADNEMIFASYLAYSIGFLILIQTLIHMSVNIGLVPTKGMGLPFISFGGTNILVMFICVGILIRIQIENRKKISQAVQRSY